MSSSPDPKSSLDFGIDWEEPPSGRDAECLNVDRQKNAHGERESSPTTFKRLKSTYVWSVQMALVVACITAFLISICSYDSSHSHPASQGTFSSVCFPRQSECHLRLYLPNILVDPPTIVFVISVLGFFTLVFVLHGIRRADIYQDQILASGVVCGSILCGFLALQEEGVAAFRKVMPATITATLATSAMIHTILEKRSNA